LNCSVEEDHLRKIILAHEAAPDFSASACDPSANVAANFDLDAGSVVVRVTAGCRHQVGGVAQPGRRLDQRHGGGRHGRRFFPGDLLETKPGFTASLSEDGSTVFLPAGVGGEVC